MSMNSAHGHHSVMKYHDHPGGQPGDTLTDFVSLVCQEVNNSSQGQVCTVSVHL